MKSNNRRTLVIMLVMLSLVLILGASYALWQITLKQQTTNAITTGCLNVELNDKNPIALENAYPITDADGEKLVPYEFTLTNTCDTLVKYQINLEVLNTTSLNNEYVKVKFQDRNANLLTSNNTVVKVLDNASISYNLEEGGTC